MTSMMIRSTVAAGKGQLLKASTRAVPLGSVADHSAPMNEGTSIAVAKGVCEAKGHNCHWPNGDLEKQDGHVIYHDHVKGSYELLVVSKPKAIGTTSFAMSKALSPAVGVPSAISGIGVTSQFRYMSSNVPAPYGPAPRDLSNVEHKLHNDMEVPSFDDYRRTSTKDPTKKADDVARKTFTYSMTAGVGVLGTYTAMKFVSGIVGSLMPAKALAMGQIEVGIGDIPEGKNMIFNFQGKPLFVRRRTAAEVAIEAEVNVAELRDPQTDADRCVDPNFLVVIGVCTHLGCIPVSHQGDFGGYYCPCHGSHYDASGRIRKGPAPLNLEVPKYKFIEEGLMKVG